MFNTNLIINNLGVADIGSSVDCVVRVSWRLEVDTGLLDGFEQPVVVCESGRTILPNTSSDSFTPFEQLTEQQVCGWVMQTAEYQEALNKATAQAIKLSAPPTMVKPLPWA